MIETSCRYDKKWLKHPVGEGMNGTPRSRLYPINSAVVALVGNACSAASSVSGHAHSSTSIIFPVSISISFPDGWIGFFFSLYTTEGWRDHLAYLMRYYLRSWMNASATSPSPQAAALPTGTFNSRKVAHFFQVLLCTVPLRSIWDNFEAWLLSPCSPEVWRVAFQKSWQLC